MTDLLEKCEKVLNLAPPDFVDNFARKQLGLKLDHYQNSNGKKLADLVFKVDGKQYPNLLDAIVDLDEWKEMEIHFYHPNIDEIWEYDTPTKLIKTNQDGTGALMIYHVNPFAINQWDPKQEPKIEAAMFRCYLSHFYSPETIKDHTNKVDERPLVPPRPLCNPYELWDDIRLKGIVPFQMALCAYAKSKRYLFQLDLLNNSLVMDFRNGKIPIKNRVFRDPIEYYNLDYFLSTYELPDLASKVLQVFFELEDGNYADIQIGLGITEKMAQNNITALAKRGFLEAKGKPPKARYYINLNNIKQIAGGIK